MKKVALFALMSLMLACTSQPEYTIIGEIGTKYQGEISPGDEIYLRTHSQNQTIDTAIVTEDYTFTFTGVPNTMSIADIMGAILVLEEGEISVKLTGVSAEIGGTPMNEEINEIVTTSINLIQNFRKNEAKIKEEFKGNDELIQENLVKLYSQYTTEDRYHQTTAFNANRLNVIGAFLYTQLVSDETSTADIQQYMKENMYAAYNLQLLEILNSRQCLENTSEGKPFTDFKVRDITDSKDVKLSDYVGKGSYVLVDFWASWCGPCIAELPTLRKVKEEFGPKGLVVLGVNVWDQHKNALETIEKEKMDWTNIYAPEGNRATKIYGIKGIPTVILFAPDGTIVSRTLRGEATINKMKEIYK